MLNIEQQIHNNLLDFEIEECKIENRRREDSNILKKKAWELLKPERDCLRKEKPKRFYSESCPNLDIKSQRRVIGIRYV